MGEMLVQCNEDVHTFCNRDLGIENVELKSRRTGTILGEDDLDSKAKAWLLMVESAKVDDDHTRKITPKSIFIAPLLTSRSTKCKEGYRHDHLGQCVKVIKVDQKTQLELLLKRLSAMYADKKAEEEGLPQISSGPLHISLPISGGNDSDKDDAPQVSDSGGDFENQTAEVPYQLTNYTRDGLNETDEFDQSGSGSLNNTYLEEGSGVEGSGTEQDDECCNGTTDLPTLIPDELDYTEAESTSTEVPYTTESYESVVNETESTDFLPVSKDPRENDSRAEEVRSPDSSRIVFPTDSSEIRPTRPHNPTVEYQPWSPVGHFRPTHQYDVRKLPPQQLWWLPPNWRIDDEQRKPAVFKFWSHVPLVQDTSVVGESQNKERRPYLQHFSEPVLPTTRLPEGFTYDFQHFPPTASRRRGRVYQGRRINPDFLPPRAFHAVS